MNIPISLIFFTSTKGHYDHKGIYLDTLNHLDKQIPLDSFSVKIAHIKVSPDEMGLLPIMETELVKRGFKTIVSIASWDRGQSHQNEYMKDVIKVSKEKALYSNPHVLWLEDDSVILPGNVSLEARLHEMTRLVDYSPDILSCRFIRRADYDGGVPVFNGDGRVFFSPYFDFQPSILRSRDFYLAAKTIEDNIDKTAQVQCEMLWRLVLAPFSRAELKHLVWYPNECETVHLGVPDYLNVRKTLSL
jgi:hypothetical protein